jgi:cell division protein ZapA (FtsZ GTPase activity inhibitor)
MLNKTAFNNMTSLQYKVKDLAAQVRAFKSGEKYQKLVAFFEDCLAAKDRVIKQLKFELAEVRAQYVDVRNNWLEVTEDLEAEHIKEIRQKNRIIDTLQKTFWNAQNTIDDLKEKLAAQKKELYKVQTELEDEKGKVLKLVAQINRDYENSSIPSSQKPNRKKITNNREKTGRKPGGQPGHKGHHRRIYTPTHRVEIEPMREHRHPDYKETGRIITKQLVNIRVVLDVTEYSTPEFRFYNGQRVHAPFPEGLVNEVTYGGSIKAFAFLLNNRCNVSIEKTSDFIAELTGGELKLSTGMISGLSKEFSKKTAPEQKKAFADMLLTPAIYTDFTTAKVNGINMAVLVCANDTGTIYFAKEHKGHEGVKDTPIQTYQGTLIHDHDKTFYSYGGNHQECLEHIRRYLKDSMTNEPNLKWNTQMRELINEMIHFKNSLAADDGRTPNQIAPDKVKAFEDRCDEILNLAETEYEYEPPSKYYPEGFNLYKRLVKYKSNHLLFLYNKDIDPTNNLSERLLRIFKRKQQQVMTFRSWNGLAFLCSSLGVIATLCNHGEGLYQGASAIFDRRETSTAP